MNVAYRGANYFALQSNIYSRDWNRVLSAISLVHRDCHSPALMIDRWSTFRVTAHNAKRDSTLDEQPIVCHTQGGSGLISVNSFFKKKGNPQREPENSLAVRRI